ncbi:MAG: tyrosine-type recombinase/integrase [Chthoniobacterales bacterium]|nr:tyrosine-type recombinase/integrase [Chthoniobacterales bacterium]
MKFTDPLEALRTSFLESLRVRGQTPATLRVRSQSLHTFFLWLASEHIDDVREVTREHVRAYALSLTQQRLTTHTRHVKLITLRRFFEHLESTDAILVNPCLGLLLPKLEERLPRNVLTQAEARRILDAPDTQTRKGIRDKAILELFYSTGIRGEEMAGLTIHDVDCKNGFVRVHKGKFAKDRVVPMGAKASAYVIEYLREVRLPWSAQRKDERALWLSSHRPHQAMKKQAIAAMVGAYKKAAGIERPGRTHLWRHTCATHLVANGANLLAVQRLLGHRSLKTTQLYTRVSAAEIRATIRRHPRSRLPRRSAAKPGA